MKLSEAEVRQVASLARLHLRDDEVTSLAHDMSAILSYIEKLDELDTEGVEPTSHVVSMRTPFRDDEVVNEPRPDEAVANAPAADGTFFAVPSIIE